MAMNSSTVFVGDWMLGLNMFGNTEIAMNRSNVFVGDWMPGLNNNMFGKTEMAMIMNIEHDDKPLPQPFHYHYFLFYHSPKTRSLLFAPNKRGLVKVRYLLV